MVEPVVHQIRGFPVLIIRTVFPQNNADQAHIVLFTVGDQCVPRVGREAGLAACTPLLVVIALRLHQPLVICEIPVLFDNIGRRNHGFPCRDDLSEGIVHVGGPGDLCHIDGTDIVILGMKAVRICKVCVDAPQLLRLLVHHFRKGRNAAGGIDRDRVSEVIGRFQHQAVQRLAQGDLFSRLDPQIG